MAEAARALFNPAKADEHKKGEPEVVSAIGAGQRLTGRPVLHLKTTSIPSRAPTRAVTDQALPPAATVAAACRRLHPGSAPRSCPPANPPPPPDKLAAKKAHEREVHDLLKAQQREKREAVEREKAAHKALLKGA